MTALKQNHDPQTPANREQANSHRGKASTFSQYEISLLLFALQGGNAATMPDASSCEEACPVIDNVEELLCGGTLDREQQLVRHLNNHLREALAECGLFQFMASHSLGESLAREDQIELEQANARLAEWTCEIRLDDEESTLLLKSLSRLPRSSWITMPRTIWRLRRRLKQRSVESGEHLNDV